MADVAIPIDCEGIIENCSSLDAIPKDATISTPKVFIIELTARAPRIQQTSVSQAALF